MEEFDDVGTCPKCGEDSTGVNDVCSGCKNEEWLMSDEATPYTPF